MPVIYNSKKIIPAPFVSIDARKERFEDGRIKRTLFVVNVTGKISVKKGSPDEDGDLWTNTGYPPDTPSVTADNRLAIFRDKQRALLELFSQDGLWFEIQPYDGTASIKFKPRILDINFQTGQWVEVCEYTIQMETDSIEYGNTSIDGESADVDESWTIEATDERQRTFKITHQISANRRTTYDNSGAIDQLGWELAKTAVQNAMAITFPNSIQDYGNFIGYNHMVVENIDVSGGKYAVTETWLAYDGGAYVEDYNVSTKFNRNEGLTSVDITGTVTGLSTTEKFGDRYTNAQAGWATISTSLLSRAQSISGVTLNPNPQTYSIGKNPLNGVITYEYGYSNKGTPTIANALWEQITITNSRPVPVLAKHVCIQRSIGPVLQEIGTQTESQRTISIEVQMPPASGDPPTYSSQPNVAGIISANTPTGAIQGPYLQRDEDSWVRETGRYTRTVSWIWL